MKRIIQSFLLSLPGLKRLIFYSTATSVQKVQCNFPTYLSFSEAFRSPEHEELVLRLVPDMVIHKDFISPEEEQSIFDEVDPYMSRMRYEFDHWDDAIHGFRETERLNWNVENTKILDRVRNLAFPKGVAALKHVHVLDLAKDGQIKPHIDAIRFCGDTIAGLSLLTDSVMRLRLDKQRHLYVDALLTRRSLYVMRGAARYDYTHEILANGPENCFGNREINKDRRISVICRNEPDAKHASG